MENKEDSETKETEVFGFVAWITSFLVLGMYLAWAFVPESVLWRFGIYYYPNKYWAIAVPTWITVTVAGSVVWYCGINLVTSKPLDSYHTIKDEFAQKIRERNEDGGIDEIGDIPLATINHLLYDSSDPSNELNLLRRNISRQPSLGQNAVPLMKLSH